MLYTQKGAGREERPPKYLPSSSYGGGDWRGGEGADSPSRDRYGKGTVKNKETSAMKTAP